MAAKAGRRSINKREAETSFGSMLKKGVKQLRESKIIVIGSPRSMRN